MAINFLNTVDLNQNQLNNASIQNLATDPAAGVLGQLIYNTTANTLKVCTAAQAGATNAVYSEVGGGVETITWNNGTYSSWAITGTAANPVVVTDLSAVDGTSVLGTRFLSKDNTWDVPTLPDTTYDLTTAPTGTAVRLTDSASVNDDVTISGTTGRTAMSRINASELRVDLTDSVTIVDDLTVGGVITQVQTGETNTLSSPLDMGGSTATVTPNKILNVATGIDATDAVNLGQVELLVAGIGVFQGGYNATTDPGVPVISGAANVKLDQGDYFVVTHDGDITFSDTTVSVEVGDFIFAAAAITAASDPASTEYILVIADANVAGAGATDGATQKGVSGFDSATFDVSANGWVQLKPLANPYGTSVTLTSGVDAGGETTFTVDVTALFGATASAANCKAEVLRASDLVTVYPEVSRNGTGDILFKFVPVVADSAFKALITIV